MVLSKGSKYSNEDDNLMSDLKFDDNSDNVEANTRPKRKKEKEESSNDLENDLTNPPTPYPCRFCDKIFEKSQALGGHMNKHRAEKDDEDVKKAHDLVELKLGGSLWSSHGRDGGGNLMLGQNHIGGAPMWPYLYPNHLNPNQFQLNQSMLLQQQTAQALQGGLNFPQGNYLNSLDNTRALYGHPSQKDYLSPGQLQTHYGAWVNSDFHAQAPGPSQPLQDIASNSNNVAAPIMPISMNMAPPFMLQQQQHQFEQQHRTTLAPVNHQAYQQYQLPQDLYPLTQVSIADDKSGASGASGSQSPKYPSPLLDSGQAALNEHSSDDRHLPNQQFLNDD